jgi:hypothetical protein
MADGKVASDKKVFRIGIPGPTGTIRGTGVVKVLNQILK